MASDHRKNTPPSDGGNPYDRKQHLRVVPGLEASQASGVGTDPAGMGSQDVASLLRLEPPSGAPDVNDIAPQPTSPAIADDEKAEAIDDGDRLRDPSRGVVAPSPSEPPGDELGDFELAYADGTTTPPPPKHRVLRRPNRNQRPDHEELQQPAGAGARAAHHDDEYRARPAEVERPSHVLAQQPVEISGKPTTGRPWKPLIGLTAALLLIGGVLVAGLIGGGSGELKAAQTVVQTVTTPVTVTQTTAAHTTTTSKHHVTKHRIVKHKTTKLKTAVTAPATSTPPSHASPSQGTYTTPAYKPAYTQPAQPSRSVSGESGSPTTGSSTSKPSSSSKSSSTGGSLSAGQQAALNPS